MRLDEARIETVNGQVASHIHNASVTFVQPPLPPFMSKSEARLKDAVPRVCHAQIDQVLTHGDVTANDLLIAWKAKALGCKHGELVHQFKTLDQWCLGFLLVFLGAYLLAFGIAVFLPGLSELSKQKAFLALIAIGAVMAISTVYLLLPHKIASLAITTIEQYSAES